MTRRSGFTLVETLIAVVIVAMIVLMAIPAGERAMVKSDPRGGTTRLVNMTSNARAAATTAGGRRHGLRFNGKPRWWRRRPAGLRRARERVDTLGAVENVNTPYGVYGRDQRGHADHVRSPRDCQRLHRSGTGSSVATAATPIQSSGSTAWGRVSQVKR